MKKTSEDLVKIILSTNENSVSLSKKIGVPPSTIRSIRNKNNVYLKKIDENKIVKLFIEEEKNICEISKIVGVERHTCSKILKKNGFKTSKKLDLTKEEKGNIARLCKRFSIRKVATMVGCSQGTIKRFSGDNVKKRRKSLRKEVKDIEYDRYFKEPNKENAYFLGLLASDGCVFIRDNKNAIINLTLHKQDEYMLDIMARHIGIKKESYKSKRSNCCFFQISSKNMAEDLKNYNIVPKKTWVYEPVDLKSFWFNISFIRGYYDGDGSINMSGNKVYVGFCGNENTMKYFQKFFANIGLKTSLVQDKRKYSGNFYNLSFTNIPDKYCFLKLIYENCGDLSLKRKKTKAIEFFERVEKNITNRANNKKALEKWKIIKKIGGNYEN